MAYSKWNEKSLTAYDNKVADLIAHYTANPSLCSIHIGTANSKTKMINEGTYAGLMGTCDCSCKGDCREGCYAIVHGDGIYTTARENHAQNTIMRRKNRIAYYETFFAFADKKCMNLRVNETGDFENELDVRAVVACATKYPNVKVIGYTKRTNLLSEIALLNSLSNVTIHYSVACNGNGKSEAVKHNVPTTSITFDKTKCNCPFQVAKMNGGKVNWACNKCAENGCGCFADKDIFFLAH